MNILDEYYGAYRAWLYSPQAAEFAESVRRFLELLGKDTTIPDHWFEQGAQLAVRRIMAGKKVPGTLIASEVARLCYTD